MRTSAAMLAPQLGKTAFYLDGLRYCFAMADVAAHRLMGTLDEVVRRHSAREDYEKEVASALLDAWSLVDVCHRARELVQQTPGLSPKLPAVQVFLRSTSHVKNLRDYVQHFRSGIPNIPSSWSPLWGALSWIPAHDQVTCYTIFSGNLIGGTSANSISYDTHAQRFTSEVVLFTGAGTVDLLVVTDQLRKLKSCILDWIDKHPNIRRVDGKTLIQKFKIVRPQP